MKPSSFESAIRLQFDCLARKVVGTTVKDYNRELGRRAKEYMTNDTYRVMFKDYPDVVTVEQMSKMLGISMKTAYILLRENKILHFRVGRTYKIPKLNILRYMEML